MTARNYSHAIPGSKLVVECDEHSGIAVTMVIEPSMLLLLGQQPVTAQLPLFPSSTSCSLTYDRSNGSPDKLCCSKRLWNSCCTF
jgi:hypothetical protein